MNFTVSLSVRIEGENCLLLKVCNTGIEIPNDELTRIFDKFYRIPQIDRWSQGGTDLGLALIKKND
ncbi:sensor histidine kinase [Nostocaceae cyanobacterium CENA369]|uniref:histidine kinase n=1 Tax=Dendronalium phyllosphericum CENA369 TaxID=1725256 RepID=A0A8J7LPP5_9NOST|nr:ATP-binding protein [Dendronalium phyllosphericum]MBH8577989.1 sensor histidine kinase [Dendronalium phyllosphericum CENA369]